MSDTETLTPVTDLLPGDMLDLEGDPIASLCNGGECPEDIPCYETWQYEYGEVIAIYTPDAFDAAQQSDPREFSDWLRPEADQVSVHLANDSWIVFPADHQVKVAERVTDSGEWLHAVDLMLERTVTEGDPSWGELADAQGQVQVMLVKLGSIDAVIAALETDR